MPYICKAITGRVCARIEGTACPAAGSGSSQEVFRNKEKVQGWRVLSDHVFLMIQVERLQGLDLVRQGRQGRQWIARGRGSQLNLAVGVGESPLVPRVLSPLPIHTTNRQRYPQPYPQPVDSAGDNRQRGRAWRKRRPPVLKKCGRGTYTPHKNIFAKVRSRNTPLTCGYTVCDRRHISNK